MYRLENAVRIRGRINLEEGKAVTEIVIAFFMKQECPYHTVHLGIYPARQAIQQ